MSDEKGLLLKIRGLRIEGRADEKWFEIVHGVDLDLRRGEVMGLIGESGAGKSTIGLAAMGFARDGCRISGGSIEFDGMELTSSPEEDLRMLRGARIAYVAQSAAASFNPAHKLIDQHTAAPVQHKIKTRKESQEDAMELYRRLRLPNPTEIGFRYPHQVSGGQLQRAMTAMAMSCRPDLIIFDEPTTALDVTTQIECSPPSVTSSTSSTPPRSTSRTISPSWRRWPTASRCCSRATRSRRRTRAPCSRIPRRTTPSRCGRCAASSAPRSRRPARARRR